MTTADLVLSTRRRRDSYSDPAELAIAVDAYNACGVLPQSGDDIVLDELVSVALSGGRLTPGYSRADLDRLAPVANRSIELARERGLL
jgi:hypothetical protein